MWLHIIITVAPNQYMENMFLNNWYLYYWRMICMLMYNWDQKSNIEISIEIIIQLLKCLFVYSYFTIIQNIFRSCISTYCVMFSDVLREVTFQQFSISYQYLLYGFREPLHVALHNFWMGTFQFLDHLKYVTCNPL